MTTERPARNVLPESPAPLHYDLRIEPNMTDFTFKGESVVLLEVRGSDAVSAITFDSAELTFVSGFITQGAARTHEFTSAAAFVFDERNDRTTIQVSPPIAAGQFSLTIQYTGIVNDKMRGFYRSKFVDVADGSTAYLGTTQFEACDARRAFPCWDEPARKATYSVSLLVDDSVTALSNQPIIKREPIAPGMVLVTFDRTPIMSTYLLAWTFGKMEYIEGKVPKTRGGETVVRLYTVPGKVEQGRFALDVALKTLPLYENFFGSDYQLAKCDLLAIPDFAAGAMENWGMITYRESALLCDASSSAKAREYVALVVAHELAHQWFGNLVTMDWWQELWLNESFATWVEYWAVDQLFPDWKVFTQFIVDETGRAYDLDALLSSHPVEVDIVNADQVDEVFDAISYCKGGSILRMVTEVIGLDAFRRGLEAYLSHFKYRNARTVDLWTFLGKAAGIDLAKLLSTWITVKGYPIVTVTRRDGKLHAKQNRFLANGPAPAEHDTTLWEVPLNLRFEGGTQLAVLTDREADLELPAAAASSAWIKVNANQTAFCRVLYASAADFHAVVEAAKAGHLTGIDRLGLVLDYQAFSVAGLASTEQALTLINSLRSETDASVWSAIVGLEAGIRSLVPAGDAAMRANFDKFAVALYAKIVESLGFSPRASDDHRVSQLRGMVLSRFCIAGDAAAIAFAKSQLGTEVPADLRGAVYDTLVRTGGESEWEYFKDLHEKTTDAVERTRCLRAMAASKDASRIRLTLEYAMSPAVRTQDATAALLTVARTADGGPLFLELLTTQWAALYAKFPLMILTGMIKRGIEGFASEAVADQMEAFFATGIVDEKQKASVEKSFQQGIEGCRVNAAWAKRDRAAIATFLASL